MNKDSSLDRCAVCDKQTSRRCGRCLVVYYCNQDHQRQDWRKHKSVCISVPKETTEITNKTQAHFKKQEEIIVENIIQTQQTPDKIVVAPPGEGTAGNNKKKKKKKPQIINNTSLNNSCTSEDSQKDNPTSEEDTSTHQSILFHNSDTVNSKQELMVPGPSSTVDNANSGALTNSVRVLGSSEQKILSEPMQQLGPMSINRKFASQILKVASMFNMSPTAVTRMTIEQFQEKLRHHPNRTMPPITYPFLSNEDIGVIEVLISDMNLYGVSLVKNFFGSVKGRHVLNEVLAIYKTGIFTTGELVSNPGGKRNTNVRSDVTTWLSGYEPDCPYISELMQRIDRIVTTANKYPNNGKMGDYDINGRTKAMVACYPGNGSRYVNHIDNPNKDGRCITAIYYLNLNWDVNKQGGLLKVFPKGSANVCRIEPHFDHMLFFWSDRRNPHEVQPAYDTRYAITLWYFDKEERAAALRRYASKMQPSTSK